ncbi:MAG: DedA family protein [Desulfovibrionaceae bacterium]|nr:DedA family protein [Desulfovibrionaceae bacterium]
MADLLTYWGLFLTAFIAATLLPAQSELVLSGLLLSGKQPAWALIAVASVGNTLGSAVNWLMGRYVHHFIDRRWFPVKRESLAKAEGWYHKYGRWSLFLSWAPVIGGPLTLAAGLLREPFWSFVLLVALAKTVRYLVMAGIVLSWG